MVYDLTIVGNRRLPMDFRNPSCATRSIEHSRSLVRARFARSAGAIIRWKLTRWAAFRAHGGKNRGRGAEYYYIRPPRCTYVRALACSVSLEVGGRGARVYSPPTKQAHLLVRRSAARYLQRRANSWRGLLASLVTTVFSSWSTSIDL